VRNKQEQSVKAHPRIVVALWELLGWLAVAATIGAAENFFALGWPAALGFAAVLVRFLAALVAIEVYIYSGITLITCIVAVVLSTFTSGGPIVDVIFLISGNRWAIALLALGYGVLGGILLAVILSRTFGRLVDPEVASLLARADRTTFGTNTPRKTHPAVIIFAIAATVVWVGFMLGWW
jgi:hypothetical protein